MRLDVAITQQFHDISRQKAIELIKHGQVCVNNAKVYKPSFQVNESDNIILAQDFFIDSEIYCSRAAFKLNKFLQNYEVIGQLISSNVYQGPHIYACSSEEKHSQIPQDYLSKTHLTTLLGSLQANKAQIKAIKSFIHANIANSLILDVGASAGGFTQTLLAHEARLVIAQDIGTLQLDSKLKIHDKVISFERIDIRMFAHLIKQYDSQIIESQASQDLFEFITHIQNLSHFNNQDSISHIHATHSFLHILSLKQASKTSQFHQKTLFLKSLNPDSVLDSILLEKKHNKARTQTKFFDFLVCDVSFISLTQIFTSLYELSDSMLLLFKPQFEVGKHAKRNKRGVVIDSKAIQESLVSFIHFLHDNHAKLIFVEKSLLKGKEGNEEFFIFCQF